MALGSAAVSTAVAVGVLSGGAAQAATSGGDGDPSGCASPVTYASTPIYGSRGSLAGVKLGELQLRWSWSCYANWSRVVLYGNTNRSSVTVEQVVQVEGRSTSESDFQVATFAQGATRWTPYLRVASSASVTCAQAWVSSDFGTQNFHTNGARVCA